MKLRFAGLTLVAALSAATVGCAENKLTRQNYDLIREGSSTKEEVRAAMGDKYLEQRTDKVWEYDDEGRHLSVWFEFDDQGTVTRKQWYSGDGLEHDSKDMPEGEVAEEREGATTIDR